MNITLLYARNERQDQELYDEMLAQIQERKTSVVEHCLDEATPLSGGSIQRLKDYRKREELKTLIAANLLVIRPKTNCKCPT